MRAMWLIRPSVVLALSLAFVQPWPENPKSSAEFRRTADAAILAAAILIGATGRRSRG